MKPLWPLAYAGDFVSYLIQKLTPRELALVDQVVVFGSAARGDTTRDSDVDLLVQASDARALEARIKGLIDEFESSVRVRDYWRPLGVRLPLSVKVGQPEDWAVVPAALAEHGKVLFGPYRPPGPGQASGVVFTWENVSTPGVRTNLYRNLFGFLSHGKRYPGLIATVGGQRLGKGAIWVPLEHFERTRRIFREHHIACRVVTAVDLSGTSSRSGSRSGAATSSRSGSRSGSSSRSRSSRERR